MQIFITSVNPIETAQILDKKRFHRQISEAKLIYNGILGLNGWDRSILSRMYKNHLHWLECYIHVFECIKTNDMIGAEFWNEKSKSYMPEFLTVDYILNMKKRLYTKDKKYYHFWENLGESNYNMYYINNEWCYYKQ